jgi:hypothetical protein
MATSTPHEILIASSPIKKSQDEACDRAGNLDHSHRPSHSSCDAIGSPAASSMAETILKPPPGRDPSELIFPLLVDMPYIPLTCTISKCLTTFRTAEEPKGRPQPIQTTSIEKRAPFLTELNTATTTANFVRLPQAAVGPERSSSFGHAQQGKSSAKVPKLQ